MASQHLQTSRQGDGERSSGASSNEGGGGILPRDALYEILLRVPTWVICRLRAVCRSWRSLLSDPPFIAAHAAHHQDPLFAACGVAGGEDTEIKFLDTSGRTVKRVTHAGPSSLGRIHPHQEMVLLDLLLEAEFHPLRVLDPATGAVSLLPVHDDDYTSCAFGRALSTTGGGDGEYKVLILSFWAHLCQVLTVDSSGGGNHSTWRAAPGPPVAIRTIYRETLVASGVVYHLVDSSNGWKIAAFDFEAEQWRPDLLQGPTPPVPSLGDWAARRSLAAVNGRLAAVSSTDSTMDMWLLMGSGEQVQWCKQHRVLTSSIEHQRHGLLVDAKPLWMLEDGRVAFWLRNYVNGDGTLWMYDPTIEMCTHLADCRTIGVGVYTGNPLLLI